MKEDKESRIRVDDMDARVFRAMLHFVYTDTLPEMGDGDRTLMAQHLLVAADRYDLERLKRNCEDVLGSFVDTDTVATTLVIAEQHVRMPCSQGGVPQVLTVAGQHDRGHGD